MTEQMKQALEDAANGLAWSQGQIILDKETFKQDISNIPIERMVVVPIHDKVRTSVLFGANWYLNNVWHDGSEKPTDIEATLLIRTKNDLYGLKMYMWLSKEEVENMKMWAYLHDILPTIKEE